MVIDTATGSIRHDRFDHVMNFLRKGDLLVFNTSRTLPASLVGHILPAGPTLEVRLAEHLKDGAWLALLLCVNGDRFSCGLRTGMRITFGNDLMAAVIGRDVSIPRLWKVQFSQSGSELIDSLYRLGKPIRYEHVKAPWGLDYYQNVYATEPGSAEMPSAGRPFTWRILMELKRRGIQTSTVTLHTGLSSYMDDDLDKLKPVPEEEFRISEPAALSINRTFQQGGRVIAVGTTALRVVESGSNGSGEVRASSGYTTLRISKDYHLNVTRGLFTGLHEPDASHLDILRALMPEETLWRAYREAAELGYLWHEFGDLNLIL
jgi:S-adenosylmethionine:tRNA ribosyltransferase-isomerase